MGRALVNKYKKGGVTPVPNGPLIKKKGPFKGSTLKKGGVVKAQIGKRVTKYMTEEEYANYKKEQQKKAKNIDPGFSRTPKDSSKNIDRGFDITPKNDGQKKRRVFSEDGNVEYLKRGGKVKQAKNGSKLKSKI